MPRDPSAAAPLRVALLGLGTVGREVARGLLERGSELAAAAGGREMRLAAVGVRDPGRDRGLRLPREVRRTDDLASLVTSSGVDVFGGGPAEFQAYIVAQIANWTALIKDAGIEPEG